jgi:hypothetical protein
LLYREAILTKDNLVKRNWHGNILCCFYNNFETIQHLFFDCALAKFLWRVIQLTFDLSAPQNIKHAYEDWIQNMNNTNKRLLLVGLDAVFSIWLSWNDIVFTKKSISSYMKVMFRATYWTRTWASFQKKQGQVILWSACWLMEIFAKYGWWSSNRLSF